MFSGNFPQMDKRAGWNKTVQVGNFQKISLLDRLEQVFSIDKPKRSIRCIEYAYEIARRAPYCLSLV